ncbi:glycosyltransferase family protein [Aureimonas psammosilenae]|uniref:hypothetical protein n=1 Tax=Aureimonas psammosilenae TaxID=2495496 RepID=UPI001260AF64|nr:hypothetical protein [Aureimonas psammosilenae]
MSAPRCFLCGARALAPGDRSLRFSTGRRRSFPLACTSCGVLIDADADMEACRVDLAARLGRQEFVSGDDQDYGLDIFTLRIAATRLSRGIEPVEDAQRQALMEPHSPLAAAARLEDLALRESRPVALGIICRPAELDPLLETLGQHASWAAEALILVDGDEAEPISLDIEGFGPSAARLGRRPLGGDFAGQRNALTALSQTKWMLQLDADEVLEPGTGALLGPLAALAERGGAVSIGLPRLNLVDGTASDLFPDTQYRLNHRSVRYGGAVHERPRRDWQRSFITLHGAIRHHLTRAHVEERSARYEAMDPGRGRLEEASALLEPYRP